MTSMNISLPDPLRDWVEGQVKGGRYGNASEYVRELIRRDQERQAQERLEQLLIEGLDSGDPIPVTPEFWASLRGDVQRRVQELRKNSRGGA